MIIEALGVTKSYYDGSRYLEILKGVDFALKPAERVAIVGASGSGKSTLLHILAGLDNPTTGSVCLIGKALSKASESQRAILRNTGLGFIYQFHHLLPEFSALENVAMPLWLRGCTNAQAKAEAVDFLQAVGLGDRLDHKPSALSGGERQRVAIARALVGRPACVLADEPTGNLDPKTADQICELMLALNKIHQTALLVVTHDQRLAERMDKIYRLDQGLLLAV